MHTPNVFHSKRGTSKKPREKDDYNESLSLCVFVYVYDDVMNDHVLFMFSNEVIFNFLSVGTFVRPGFRPYA